jgi:hydrogenase expression/formation protein HypC
MCLAIPGQILEADNVGSSRIAKVQFGGVCRQVYLDLLPEAQPGDYVLVHVGFAISRLEEDEAKRTYDLLRQMEEAQQEEARQGTQQEARPPA